MSPVRARDRNLKFQENKDIMFNIIINNNISSDCVSRGLALTG